MNRFAIFITALLIASGCSTEKHDDEQFFYPYEGINRFSVEYSGDTILLTARYTAEEETIKLLSQERRILQTERRFRRRTRHDGKRCSEV